MTFQNIDQKNSMEKQPKIEKEKISAFEFAIMQIADAEKAKQFEPLTRDEERVIRAKKIEQKLAVRIRCRDGSIKPLSDCI